jgi:tetratricopeptide (TPR) repeat protein
MRKLTLWTLFVVMIATSAPTLAATATDFYVELLRRGISEVEAGRNETAVVPLRLAAFGLIDSIEHYETAQVYLVVALDRMNQTDPAREAALRIIAAERVERKFGSLKLSEAIRSSFATSAKKLLSPADAAALSTPPPPARAATPPPQTSAKVQQVDAPKKVVESSSRPVVEKPATAPASSSTTRKREDSKTPPKATPPAPKPAPVQVQPPKPTIDVPARLAAGERALSAANLTDARKIYRDLLEVAGHDHATWIRVAEGLYRARDFAGALAAFQRVGTLRPGEEAYRFYVAVSYYETGQYERAKRELASALPFIEITPDVEWYRAKIDSAR